MTGTSLTEFQTTAEQRINALLQQYGREIGTREVRTGVLPAYSAESQTAVKLVAGDFECWIFDNELSYSSARGGGGFESEDYASGDELLTDALKKIQGAIEPQS